VMFHAIAGRPPFESDSLIELAAKHAREPLPALNNNEFAPVDGVLVRATMKDPAKRYQSMEELITALEDGESSDTAVRDPKAGATATFNKGQWTLRLAQITTVSLLLLACAFRARNIMQPKEQADGSRTRHAPLKFASHAIEYAVDNRIPAKPE